MKRPIGLTQKGRYAAIAIKHLGAEDFDSIGTAWDEFTSQATVLSTASAKPMLTVLVDLAESWLGYHHAEQTEEMNDQQLAAIRDACQVLGRRSVFEVPDDTAEDEVSGS